MAGGWNKGRSSARAKFTVEEVKLIRKALQEGRSISFIARVFEVHRRTIQNIAHGRTYQWVEEDE